MVDNQAPVLAVDDDRSSPVSRLSIESRRQVMSLIGDKVYDNLTDQGKAAFLIKTVTEDFYLYCEQNLKIQNKNGELVPLKLNAPQQKLADMVMQCLVERVPARFIILKARQMGFSTLIEAFCYWWTATHRYVKSVIIAHEKKSSTAIYQMFQRFYTYSTPLYRPTKRYLTKHDLTFDLDPETKNKLIAETGTHHGLESSIETMVADEGAGRGATVRFFHGSEVAFWANGEDIVAGVMQAVPLLPFTFAFLESTAHGVGGYFFDEWQAAKRGESAFTPLFVAWHELDEYELNVELTGPLDAEETELLQLFEELGYPEESHLRKIAWRRAKKREFKTNPDKFYQEYPKDDMEAFVATGRPVFDTKSLLRLEERAQSLQHTIRFADIIAMDDKGRKRYALSYVDRAISGVNPTPLKIIEPPVKGERYTISGDVSEGIVRDGGRKEGDYSVLDVQRNTSNGVKTVARWRGHVDPDMLGDIAYKLGVIYNNALIGIEVNNHGLTTVQSLRNKFYHNLYRRETAEDELFQTTTSKMGWLTTRKNKNSILIDTLIRALREGQVDDIDLDFIRECMTYVRDDQGRANAQEGCYDDTVMAKAINLQLADYNSYNQEYAKENIVKPVKNRGELSHEPRKKHTNVRSALRKRPKKLRR